MGTAGCGDRPRAGTIVSGSPIDLDPSPESGGKGGTGGWLSWLERYVDIVEVTSSNLVPPM